jgi:hypothetical protein
MSGKVGEAMMRMMAAVVVRWRRFSESNRWLPSTFVRLVAETLVTS